jgi:hypothetical protein
MQIIDAEAQSPATVTATRLRDATPPRPAHRLVDGIKLEADIP